MCKLFHGDWAHDPDVLWTQAQGIYRTDLAAFLLNYQPKWVWTLMQYTALLFELSAPVLFTFRRLLPTGIVVGIGFQLGIALTMNQLIFFSLQMMTFYLLFIDAGTLRAVRTWLLRRCEKIVKKKYLTT